MIDGTALNEATRRALAEQIKHSSAMEGLEISDETAKLIEEWIVNNISIEDVIEHTKQRYQVEHRNDL